MGPQPNAGDEGLKVLVVGNDMLVEALPARPIQVAHACRMAGFDLIVPLSWGDELVAEAALGTLSDRRRGPAVFCACPLVRQRLLSTGDELAPRLVSLVAPPVAVSRQLRATMGDRLRTLTYVGRCPSARPPAYDFTFDPAELLALLDSRGIAVESMPDLFMDTLPPDRRRHLSAPGGCPDAEILWHACNERILVDLESRDLPVDLGELLLSNRPVLVDVAPQLGCACSGVTTTTTGREARIAVTSLEPPRASGPVMEAVVGIELTEEPKGLAGRGFPSSRGSRADEEGDASDIESGRSRPPIAITPPSALRIPSDPTAEP
jgi:hypothetical protein